MIEHLNRIFKKPPPWLNPIVTSGYMDDKNFPDTPLCHGRWHDQTIGYRVLLRWEFRYRPFLSYNFFFFYFPLVQVPLLHFSFTSSSCFPLRTLLFHISFIWHHKLHTVSLVCGEKKSGFVEFRRIKLEFTGSDLIFDPSTVSTQSPSYSRKRGIAKAVI